MSSAFPPSFLVFDNLGRESIASAHFSTLHQLSCLFRLEMEKSNPKIEDLFFVENSPSFLVPSLQSRQARPWYSNRRYRQRIYHRNRRAASGVVPVQAVLKDFRSVQVAYVDSIPLDKNRQMCD